MTEPLDDDLLDVLRGDAEYAKANTRDYISVEVEALLSLLARLDKAEADAATARGLLSSLLNGDGPAVVPSPNPTA